MKFFKTLFGFCCIFVLIISIQSCHKDEIQPDSQEVSNIDKTNSELSLRNEWPCWEMMNEISWAYGDECAANTAQLLQEALDNYVNNPSTTTIVEAMFIQIGYFIDLVNCDPGVECYNCDEYLALAQAFDDCLEENDPVHGASLDNIIVTLQNACESQCEEAECCDDVSLIVTTIPHPTQEGCCLIEVHLEDPGSCTNGTGFRYYPAGDASYPMNFPATLTHCPGYGPVQFQVDGCYVSETVSTSDCKLPECCEGGLSITQEPHPTRDGCCYVYVVDPCEDQFTVILTDDQGIARTYTYTGSRTLLLCENETLQVTDNECFFDSGLITADCTNCCDDSSVSVTTEQKGRCCLVTFNLEGCVEGFLVEWPWGTFPLPGGNSHTFALCNNFQRVRVIHSECRDIKTAWYTNNCGH